MKWSRPLSAKVIKENIGFSFSTVSRFNVVLTVVDPSYVVEIGLIDRANVSYSSVLKIYFFWSIFPGMHFQQDIRQHRVTSLLQWRFSTLQLRCVLQAVVFHFQWHGVLCSSSHWWSPLHCARKEPCGKSAPSEAHRGRLWGRSRGNRGRGILGRELQRLWKRWRLHRMELSISDLRGRITSPTGLKHLIFVYFTELLKNQDSSRQWLPRKTQLKVKND